MTTEIEPSIYADLHIHTVRSDGSMTLTGVIETAQEIGLDAIAITDHDRVHPGLQDPITEIGGVTVIRGVELRVELDNGDRIDLLGYGVTLTDSLEEELTRVKEDRIARGQRMIDLVEDECGVDLPLEAHDGIGRPHVARAIADHPDIDHDYEGAFQHLIGYDCPCYTSRNVTSFETGVDVLTDGCAVVGLAHPFRYDNPEAKLELASQLDAVERYYPYGDKYGDPDIAALDQAISEYDLLPTGGTDAHEHTLGKAGVSGREFETLAEKIRSAETTV